MGRRRPATDLDGIFLVDKPAGWTSHDVVNKLRRLTGQPRIGHTGTLDPAATGLLAVCLGKATRLVEYMTGHGKRYTGEIALGVRTATDDAEGEVIATAAVPEGIDLDALAQRFTGDLLQVPPAYSAVHAGGERAYAAARAGRPATLAARPVRVDRLTLTFAGPDRVTLDLECGPGTYVRSLARDIGEALGCGAHLASLRRLRVGAFTLDAAWTLDEVAALQGAGLLGEALLPADEGVLGLEAAIVDAPGAAALAMGQAAPVAILRMVSAPVRVFDREGTFVGIATLDAEASALRPAKVIAAPEGLIRAAAGTG